MPYAKQEFKVSRPFLWHLTGGFRLAMEQAGHECIGHCEIDRYADKSYRAMHNVKENEFYANDIRTIIPEELPDFDCICGGFPCQSFSIAGKRGGFEDTRGTLFFEIARIISVRKPKLVFLENVAGLLSHDSGTTFETILRTLGELGYWYEYQVINGKNYLPQNRERVFIVGHLRGSGRAVFPIRQEDCNSIKIVGGLEPKILCDSGTGRKWEERNECPALRVGGDVPCVQIIGNVNPSSNGMNGNVPCIISSNEVIKVNNDTATTLLARDYKGLNTYGINGVLTTNKGEGSKILIPILTPDRPEKRQNGRRCKEDGDEMFTLTAQDRHGVILRQSRTEDGKAMRKDYESGKLQISRHEMVCLEPRDDGITNTLSTVQKDNLLFQNYRIRKLTPKECFRLQGFTDEDFYKAKAVNSDSQLYKQAGNSVMVPCVYDIARRL